MLQLVTTQARGCLIKSDDNVQSSPTEPCENILRNQDVFLLAEGPQDQTGEAAKHLRDLTAYQKGWLMVGLPSENTYDIRMLEKNAVARSEISFVLQEGWRSLNWHHASSDISYFLDKVSCVPDLKCHCGGCGGGGSGGWDLVSVCLGWEWWSQVEKKMSQAVAKGLAEGVPCHKHPRHLFG